MVRHAALYFRNAFTTFGYCNSNDVLVSMLFKYISISWSMVCPRRPTAALVLALFFTNAKFSSVNK